MEPWYDLPEIDRQPALRSFDKIDALACLVGSLVGGLVLGLLCYREAQPHTGMTNLYGYGVFLFVPLLTGIITGAISNWRQPSTIGAIWISAFVVNVLCAIGLLVTGLEGAVCVGMSIPVTLPVMGLGIVLARAVLHYGRAKRKILFSAVPAIVAVGGASILYSPGFVNQVESTTIIINGPPEKIWPYLFELDGLPEPDQWIFRTGIAYTKGTRSGGRNVGDWRQCMLTTGNMNETIAAVEPNRYLRFNVLNTPPSMRESNPFYDIHPRHETGTFVVHWGEFRLEALPGGRTRLTGTSSYSYNIYPAWYWGLYTDTVAEQIHMRMMNEIKRRVEAP